MLNALRRGHLLALLLLASCTECTTANTDDPADAATVDAGAPDASSADASRPDAAMPDAAMPDAAMPDAAMPDAGAGCDSDAGQLECAGACVEPTTDLHCGGCASCGATEACVGSACVAVCRIGGDVVMNGASNAANACETCDTGASTSAWTVLDNGTPCGTGGACFGGACEPVCVIGGVTHRAQAQNPDDPCQVCDPAVSMNQWSAHADGAACGAGMVCGGGACVMGCFVGGAVVAAGAHNPANDCEACAPLMSTTAWTGRADRALCGMGQYCVAAACTSTWHAVSSSLPADYGMSAAATLDGRIVLFGGSSSATWSNAHVYNPATDMVEATVTGPSIMYRSCATRAADGRIYVLGGQSGAGDSAETRIFDPATRMFSAGPAMPVARSDFSCATGMDGTLYAFAHDPVAPGGLYPSSRTLALAPGQSSWTTLPGMPQPRQATVAVLLEDGRMAVMGGNRGYIFGALSVANEIFDPTTGMWSTGADVPALVHDNSGTLRADGRVVVGGGLTSNGRTTATYVYDPVTDRWTAGLPLSIAHYAGWAVTTPDRRMYFLLGRAEAGESNVIDVGY